MQWGIRIMPKPEVLDSSGRTVLQALKREGFPLTDCHIGKYIILNLPTTDSQRAYTQIKNMAEKVLHNPLTENFTIEKLES